LELGLHLWTQCASALGVVPFGGVDNFWLRMTDFGVKTMFLTLKLCQAISQAKNFWLCLTDFGIKNQDFDLKTLLGYISVPF